MPEHLSHSHGPTVIPDGHDYASANRDHFDEETSAKYDQRSDVQELARRLSKAIVEANPPVFREEGCETEMLDFACGPGVMSRALAPYVKSIVGVDISEHMVNQYNKRVYDQGIPPEEMRAVAADLKGTENELDGKKFDVVICTVAYHHFGDIVQTTKILAYFLKPGGSLIVADILKAPNVSVALFADHNVEHIVPHQKGFDEADMKRTFEAAGLEFATFEKAAGAKKDDQTVEFFLARASKPL